MIQLSICNTTFSSSDSGLGLILNVKVFSLTQKSLFFSYSQVKSWKLNQIWIQTSKLLIKSMLKQSENDF